MTTVQRGDRLWLEITKIEHPGCIWAREVKGENTTDRVIENQQLQQEINNYFNDFSTQKIPVSNPVHNQVCIARRNQDRRWHRVRVDERIGNSRLISCFLLDEGTQEEFNQDWMKEAPPQFTRVVFQAKRFALAGIKPLSMQTTVDMTVSKQPAQQWDVIATKYIMKQLKGGSFPEAEVMHVQGSHKMHVRLYVGADKVCLNDELVRQKYAYDTQQHHTPESSSDEGGLRRETFLLQSGDRPGAALEAVPRDRCGITQSLNPPVTSAPSHVRSMGRGLMALAANTVSSPPGPGPGVAQTTAKLKLHGDAPTEQRSLQLPGIKPLKSPLRKEAADAVSAPLGRGQGRMALLAALNQVNRSPADKTGDDGQSRQSSSSHCFTSSQPGYAQPTARKQVSQTAGAVPSTPDRLMARQVSQSTGAVPSTPDCLMARQVSQSTGAVPSTPDCLMARQVSQSTGAVPSTPDCLMARQVSQSTGAVPSTPDCLMARQVSQSTGAVPSTPDRLMAQLTSEPYLTATRTELSPQAAVTSGASSMAGTMKARHDTVPSSEVIPIPKLNDIDLVRPPPVTRTTHGGGKDCDSKLQSRLPKCAQTGSRQSSWQHSGSASDSLTPPAVSAVLVPAAGGRRSDSQSTPASRLPDCATHKTNSMRCSDTEEVARRSNVQPEVERQPKRSSGGDSETQLSDVSYMKQTYSGDMSPERYDYSSLNITGYRKEKNEHALNEGCGSDTELLTFYSDQDMPTSDDLGVLLDGEVLPTFMQNTKMLFDTTMNHVIDRLDIMPTNLQSFCWPALLRLRNVVGVASSYRPAPSPGGVKQGGTSMAYLVPLIAQLLQKSVYTGVPCGVGPLALVLCSSWRRVHLVFQQVRVLMGRDLSLRVIKLHGAGSEHSQEVHLINGCQLLIATPKCLLRMLNRSIVEIKRLCHLVLDDGDKLLRYQEDEVEEIATRYEDCLVTQTERSAPSQLVLMGKHWTPTMAAFTAAHLADPTVVIASMAEAALYGQVKKIVHVVRADQRLSQLSGLLECSNLKKTVIYTDSPLTATAVHESLTGFSVYAILCHEDLPLTAQDAARQEWASPYSPGSPPILVLTDTMLTEQWQRDAEMAIHYDPPLRKEYFGPRLWCMYNNFKRPLQQPNEETKGATCILLVTTEWKPYISLVIKDLQNSDQAIPDSLRLLADQLLTSKEMDKCAELCRAFKAYGQCSTEHSCKARHSLQENLDTPGLNKLHQPLPCSGNVKVLVTSVEDATRLWVRLLEHESCGEVTDLRANFTNFTFVMHMHYSMEDNRVQCGYPIEGELYVLKDLQHTYNRVKVLQIVHKYNTKIIERVQVRMVDVGDLLWVNASELLLLHNTFLKVPFQAVEVYVCGIKPIDDDSEWTNYATDLVYDQVYSEQLDGRVVLALGNTLWLDPLVKRELLTSLGTVTHSVVIRHSLLYNELAVLNPQHMQLLYTACKDRVNLPDVLSLKSVPHLAYDIHGLPTALKTATFPEKGLDLPPVEVTAVLHPGLFYARLTKNLTQLEQVHDEIKDYVKLNRPSAEATALLKAGSLVLATSPQDEDEEGRVWYRAKLQAVTGDQCDVFFLDTGESEYVALDQVQPLPTVFTHWPLQAIECRLPHIAPVQGEEWGEEVGDPLWCLVSDCGDTSKPLQAEVVATEEALNIGLTKYAVRLFDSNSEFDVDIAQELVAQGHALPLPGMIKAEMPAVDPSFQAAYGQMPDLCTELVLTKDHAKKVSLVDQIQRIIRANQDDVEGLCRSRAVGALCQALGYLSNLDIVDLICKCVVLLTKLHPRVFEAILQDDGVTALCRMFARPNIEGHRIVSATIAELLQQQRLREEFVNRGLLRLLASLLYRTDTEDPETIKKSLIAIREVAVALTERHRPLVLRSGCVAALCHQVEQSKDHTDLANSLHALTSLFVNVRLQEESRRWAAPVLCAQLRVADERPHLVNPVVLAVCALAQGSRINKDCLLDYDILDTLFSLSRCPMLTRDAQCKCSELYDSLSALRRHSEFPEISQQLPTSSVSSDVLESDCEEKSARTTKDDYKNIPIPREALKIIIKTTHPQVNWFQDRWNLVLLIQVKDACGDLLVDIKEQSFRFRAVVERVEYMLDLLLFELIDPDRCETQVRPGEVRVGLRKVTPGNWPRVIKQRGKLPYLVPDFTRYIEESDVDSDEEQQDGRLNESPLEIIERCRPRPPGLPPPTTEYVSSLKPGQFHPYDPSDDPNYKSPSSGDDDDDDDQLHVDDHEKDLQRNFFNL